MFPNLTQIIEKTVYHPVSTKTQKKKSLWHDDDLRKGQATVAIRPATAVQEVPHRRPGQENLFRWSEKGDGRSTWSQLATGFPEFHWLKPSNDQKKA
jgi:hypothetical protein